MKLSCWMAFNESLVVTDCQSSVCCPCPSPVWGYITLCTALDCISLKCVLLSAMYTTSCLAFESWLTGERRCWCLVEVFCVVLKMFYLSSILFLIANAGIPCTGTQQILWADARLTTCALYFRWLSISTWASNSASQRVSIVLLCWRMLNLTNQSVGL